MTFKVLLVEAIDPKGMALLEKEGFEVVLASATDKDTLQREVVDSDALIIRTSPLPKEVIDAGKQLKLIARHGIGVDNIDLNAATAKNILVSKVLNANAYSVAEYSVAAMMTLGRNLLNANEIIRTGHMSDKTHSLPGLVSHYKVGGSEIKGKVLGIVGYGSIGRQIVSIAKGFNIDILVYDAYTTIDEPHVTQVESLDDLLAQSDFITLHIPLTDETHHLFNEETFKKMKNSAFLINASRGGVVDETALRDALNQEIIAGACVDVYSVEPPQLDNDLFDAKNIILTPHIAGTTVEAIENLSIGASQAVVDFYHGKAPRYLANPEVLEEKKGK